MLAASLVSLAVCEVRVVLRFVAVNVRIVCLMFGAEERKYAAW